MPSGPDMKEVVSWVFENILSIRNKNNKKRKYKNKNLEKKERNDWEDRELPSPVIFSQNPTRRQKLIIRNKKQTMMANSRNKRII